MIVKNEEKHLANALLSISKLNSEIIIIDTGSTDNTINIAKNFGAKIFNFKWNNNFSKARNFSLKKATADWIFVLDADETISAKDIKKFQPLLIKDTAISFTTRNYLKLNTIPGCIKAKGDYEEEKGFFGWIESTKIRLFPNNPKILFQNIVHEVVEPSIISLNMPIQKSNIPVHHFGFHKDLETQLEKSNMHLSMLKEQLKLSPNQEKCYFDIGFILFNQEKYQEAINYFIEALKKNNLYANALFYLSKSYLALHQDMEAKENLDHLLSLQPDFSEAHYLLGNIHFNKNRLLDALRNYQKVIYLNPNHPEAFFKIGTIYEKTGQLEKAQSAFLSARAILK